MTKYNARELLTKSLSNVKLKNSIIDLDTINLEIFWKIFDSNLYKIDIDRQFFWHIFIIKAIKIYDFENKSRSLSEQEIDQIVSSFDELLLNAPYDYTIYFRLPEDYPGTISNLGVIEIVEIDYRKANLLEEKNRSMESAKLLSVLNSKKDVIPKVGEKYILVRDKGIIISGDYAYLELNNYSPDRLVGLFYALHIIFGTIETNSYKRYMLMPRVFSSDDVYRSNFHSPLKGHRAELISFKDDLEKVNIVNKKFKLITDLYSEADEKIKIQIFNSLYWYLEFLNHKDWSLQCVFLVSAIDSLFPTRKNSATKSVIVPTVNEKALVVAEAISSTELDKRECMKVIEELFNSRNEIIHGKIEINGNSRMKLTDKNKYNKLLDNSEIIVRNYIAFRVNRLILSRVS